MEAGVEEGVELSFLTIVVPLFVVEEILGGEREGRRREVGGLEEGSRLGGSLGGGGRAEFELSLELRLRMGVVK